ncbi:MAG: hypothetical protein J6X49_12840 [Victivallales bacterium]|nr:hypothetical protein [Victivallales bacterium]
MEEKRKDELRQAFIKSGLTKEEWKVACKYLKVDTLKLAEICDEQSKYCKGDVSQSMSLFVNAFNKLSEKHILIEEIQNTCNVHTYRNNDVIDVYLLIYFVTEQTKKNNSDFIVEMRDFIKLHKSDIAEIFQDTGFDKRHIRRIISTVPPSQWDLRIQNARMRQNDSGKKQLKLANGRLINILLNKELLLKNKLEEWQAADDEEGFLYKIETGKRSRVYLETDDVMPFIDLVVLSAVYTLIDAGYKVITVKDIWETTHFTGEWDNVKPEQRKAFMKIIDEAKKRLKRHIMTKDYDEKWCCTTKEYGMFVDNGSYFLGKLGYTDNADVVFVIEKVPVFFQLCKKEHRLISIPNEILESKNCKIDWLEKIYIARRIVLSANQKNRMIPSMKWKTAETELGKGIDHERAKGYMRFLKEAQLIEGYSATASKLEWKTVLQIGEATSEKSLVILKDENGKVITADVPKPEKIERVEAELRAYNDYLANSKVVLNETELDCSLVAIYNRGSYDLGGRMYTTKEGHQYKTKTERKQITINGNATVEIDFSCYHTNMLYNLQGLPLEGDAYDFANDRQKAKRVLNTCLDAKNETKAKCSIASYLCSGDNDKEDKEYEEYKAFIPEAEELMRKAEARHVGIKGRFYTDNALSLQNLDAEIMLTIIDELRRKKILALPIHDSIIVEKKYLAKAKKTMEKVYKKRMGFDCRIKVEE